MSHTSHKKPPSWKHAEELRGGQRRYYDRALEATVVRVFQGDYYVTSNPGEILTTTLGSCIAVCIRDPIVGFGGMNHFVLPAPSLNAEKPPSLAMRYGSYSIERLVNIVLGEGGLRERLEIKVFGGANIVEGMGRIGYRNADFVEKYLQNEGLSIAAHHLRGVWPRKIRYSPVTGQIQLRELTNNAASEVFDREARLQRMPVAAGKVELFK